jgi:hypothetical protein
MWLGRMGAAIGMNFAQSDVSQNEIDAIICHETIDCFLVNRRDLSTTFRLNEAGLKFKAQRSRLNSRGML